MLIHGLLMSSKMQRGTQFQNHRSRTGQQAESDMGGVLPLGHDHVLLQADVLHYVSPNWKAILQSKLNQV